MAKPLVVVVVPDENYLNPLEIKLVEMLWLTADVEIISDEEYFVEYFTIPKKIDVLVIDSVMYSEKLQLHDIGKTFVLTENWSEQTEADELDKDVVYIYKLSNLIADNIITYVPGYGEGSSAIKKETKVVAVVSPSGGTGVTTIAMGLSSFLHQNLKKVLYVNLQMYQSFYYYLKNKSTLPMEACVLLKNGDKDIYGKLSSFLHKEGVHYFPPLKSSREALGISAAAYVDFIEKARSVNYYDFIVVDIGNELSAESLRVLDFAKRVYIVTTQDSYSAFKLEVFRRNVNCNDTEKYSILCNRFEKEKENFLISQTSGQTAVVQDYVELVKDRMLTSCEELGEVRGIQKLVYKLV